MFALLSKSFALSVFVGALGIAIGLASFSPAFSYEKPKVQRDIFQLSLEVLIGEEANRRKAVRQLVADGDRSIIPTLVLLMRIAGDYKPVARALQELTGEKLSTWRQAMLWQEAHPEIVPHSSYRALKLRWFKSIDKRFDRFFHEEVASRDKMKIRIEEITWGGARVDSIPSLDNPKMVDVSGADYMNDSDLVFGVAINGDVRAYPLRIMGWHEMVNDVIGGVPVALAYCTLCGSGILFETQIEGRAQPFVFGSSGLLYRSNKLMFDRKTNSLWNQFSGQPVVGSLVDQKFKLKIRPVTITSWAKWKTKNPTTKVLDINTGHIKDYDPGVVYKAYFSSPHLMFPAVVRDESVLKRKDYVFGIRDFGAAKAWPISAFSSKRVINDRVGTKEIVLIGDEATHTVRAYESNEVKFSRNGDVLIGGGQSWAETEDFLIGSKGGRLPRVSGHIAYWFAWDSYLGVTSELYQDD